MKFFNIAGPVKVEKHYALPPLSRIDLTEVMMLIEQEKYFVLHAPRQSGKTSCLLALMHHLNQQGNYHCLYMNAEIVQAKPEDMQRNIRTLLSEIAANARDYLRDPYPESIWMDVLRYVGEERALGELLSRWAAHSPQPLILLIDEVDALMSNTLISVLRQLRTGHAKRPHQFPQSVILCGVRDVRHYRLYSQEDQTFVTGGSVFNVKSEALRLGDFSAEQTRALYEQHTQTTGQVFTPEALDRLWHLTQGQPWLVNALGHEVTWKNKAARDRSRPISLADYQQARERLIYSRATHLDQLSDKLREPRVHSVLSAIIGSKDELQPGEVNPDDVQYVTDLGLIIPRPSIRISNRIYQEVIPRELTWVAQSYISNQEQSWYVTPEHRLDMPKLLTAFQQFFREHSDIWSEGFSYKEAAPQLIMQAFLQRIINGGGRINREYGLGRKRTDLFIEWPTDPELGMYGPLQRVVIELKIQRGALEPVLAKGLEQTADYTQRVGADEAHLLIFDRRPDVPWDQKIWQRPERFGNLAIGVWGA